MTKTLDHLLDRNVAWAEAKTRNDPDCLWIGCSDSRVTAIDVLGLDPGAVFVHRNIANVVHTSDLNILSVLKFAIERLRVRHIIVCGHCRCGGIERALSEDRSAMVDHWLQPITMLYRKHRGHFDRLQTSDASSSRMCEINIDMQVRRIALMPLVENGWSRGQELDLHGWIHGIHDGLIRDLGPHWSSIAERDALPSIDEHVFSPVEPTSRARRQAIASLDTPAPTGTSRLPSNLSLCCGSGGQTL